MIFITQAGQKVRRDTHLSLIYCISWIISIIPGWSSSEPADHSRPRHPQGQHQCQLQQGACQNRYDLIKLHIQCICLPVLHLHIICTLLHKLEYTLRNSIKTCRAFPRRIPLLPKIWNQGAKNYFDNSFWIEIVFHLCRVQLPAKRNLTLNWRDHWRENSRWSVCLIAQQQMEKKISALLSWGIIIALWEVVLIVF